MRPASRTSCGRSPATTGFRVAIGREVPVGPALRGFALRYLIRDNVRPQSHPVCAVGAISGRGHHGCVAALRPWVSCLVSPPCQAAYPQPRGGAWRSPHRRGFVRRSSSDLPSLQGSPRTGDDALSCRNRARRCRPRRATRRWLRLPASSRQHASRRCSSPAPPITARPAHAGRRSRKGSDWPSVPPRIVHVRRVLPYDLFRHHALPLPRRPGRRLGRRRQSHTVR